MSARARLSGKSGPAARKADSVPRRSEATQFLVASGMRLGSPRLPGIRADGRRGDVTPPEVVQVLGAGRPLAGGIGLPDVLGGLLGRKPAVLVGVGLVEQRP